MADMSTTPKKKGTLPPITAADADGDDNKPKKKVVKKKKKPPADGEAPEEGEKPKAAPRKKTKASASSTGDGGGQETVPKKKKKVVKKTTEAEGEPASARSGGSQPDVGEDVDGSKASLIKSPKDGTPRKKKVKKKVKKTPEEETPTIADNFFDSTLAADLTEVQDDVIDQTQKKDIDDDDDDDHYKKQPHSTGMPILRSQPTEKFYIETDSGFKGENKHRFVKRQLEEAKEKAIIREEPSNTTIEFAISTQKVLRTFFLFAHGLLAGFSAWHIVMTYVLLNFGHTDFLQHYVAVSMSVQCIFYLLITLCTVSACDRFDIAVPKGRFLLKAFTLQNGAVSVPIYFAALVLSLVNGAYEDKIHLFQLRPDLWNDTETATNDVNMWRDLNTARNVLCVLGWFIISIVPVTDRLIDNLRQTDEEDLLGVNVVTGKDAMA